MRTLQRNQRRPHLQEGGHQRRCQPLAEVFPEKRELHLQRAGELLRQAFSILHQLAAELDQVSDAARLGRVGLPGT